MNRNLIAGLVFSLIGCFVLNNQALASSEGEGFDAGSFIQEHIQDAHEIHFWGHTALYLPVILYDEDGVRIFSSSHFYHSEDSNYVDGHGMVTYYEHEGYIMHEEKIYKQEAGLKFTDKGEVANKKVLDLSITKSVAGMFLTMLLMFILFLQAARGYKKNRGKAPKGIQSALEPLIVFIRDEVARPSIGPKADAFVPFLLSLFFFIWIANILGLIPFIGGFNVMGTMSVTLVLAAIVFVITTIKGNRHYWSHILWPSGVPLPIKLILVPIEFAGIFIKPAVLMIRLTANITAGHIIILSFASLIFIFGKGGADLAAGYGVGVGSTLFMIFIYLIEVLVAFLQAYVFCLLAALYFGSAVEEAHH